MFNCELKSQMTLSKNTDNIVKRNYGGGQLHNYCQKFY